MAISTFVNVENKSSLRLEVATGLHLFPAKPNTFRAENFDVLYDSPVEASDFKVLSFAVKGVPHRIVIDGEGKYDPERMQPTCRRLSRLRWS